MFRIAGAARWAGLILSVSACSIYSSPDQPAEGSVDATPELAFRPAEVKIRAHGSITWNFGPVPHNVAFAAVEGSPDDIPGLNSETSIARTFSTPGTYAYECSLHPGMRGTVVVAADRNGSYPTTVLR